MIEIQELLKKINSEDFKKQIEEAIDKINQSTANQIAKSKGKPDDVTEPGTDVKTDPVKS